MWLSNAFENYNEWSMLRIKKLIIRINWEIFSIVELYQCYRWFWSLNWWIIFCRFYWLTSIQEIDYVFWTQHVSSCLKHVNSTKYRKEIDAACFGFCGYSKWKFWRISDQKRIPNYHEDKCEYFMHIIYEMCSKYFILHIFC